jgi:crotonobetainyl-CoA:carnitine CoA-transferase CaiB-like acyl-CoA transferase
MREAGRADLADDPRCAVNSGRVAQRETIDAAIEAWTRTLPSAEVLRRLEAAGVPAGPIQSVAEVVRDPQFVARGCFEEVPVGGRPLKLPAIGPRLADTPGRTDRAGGALGADRDEVLRDWLRLSPAEIARLAAADSPAPPRDGGVTGRA